MYFILKFNMTLIFSNLILLTWKTEKNTHVKIPHLKIFKEWAKHHTWILKSGQNLTSLILKSGHNPHLQFNRVDLCGVLSSVLHIHTLTSDKSCWPEIDIPIFSRLEGYWKHGKYPACSTNLDLYFESFP
jgi:hypothetical protein